MTPFRLKLQPGFFTEDSERNAENRWTDGNLVRFKDGRPEKFGGWEQASVTNDGSTLPSSYTGVVLLTQVDDGSLREFTGVQSFTPVGNGVVSTGQVLYGGNSWFMAGTGTDRTNYIEAKESSDRFIFTGDVTMEGYFYLTSYADTYNDFFCSQQQYNNINHWLLQVQSNGTVLWLNANGGLITSAAGAFTLNAWHHVAFVKSGTNGFIFIDGVIVASGAIGSGVIGATISGSSYLLIGAGCSLSPDNGDLVGYFAGVRITKGTARYTAPFTPPYTAFDDTGVLPTVFTQIQGIDRREHEWTSLDGQPWIAQGTSKKLYIINRGIRYDITPVRRSTTLTNPFTTNGTTTVLVTDPLHGAETGDYVRFAGATPVGSQTVNGEYSITVLNGNQYNITITAAATASTGGGTVVTDYDINTGLDSASQAHGWGTCSYGRGTFGTRRGNCSSIITPLRIWSLDNFGEDLLASPRGGALYWWDRTQGPSTRAVLIESAPQAIERMLVSPSGDQVIALGAADFNGAPDKMLIRTSDTGSIVDWEQPEDLDAENNVFDDRLSNGSRIITGTKTRGGVLINTDKMSYIMRPDPNAIWAIEELAAQNAPVGPNATLDVNGTAIWMAQKKFIGFDGVQQEFPCDVWGYIFDNDAAEEGKSPGFNLSQGDKVYAYYNDKGDEATFFYPSMNSNENDRYVCFNTTQRIWYYGALARTAMSTGGIAYSLPYGSDPTGMFFLHEGVRDANGAVMGEFIQTYDMMLGEGEFATHLSLFEPDFKRWVGTMRMTLKTKDTPNAPTYNLTATYDMLDDTTEQGVYMAGRQMAVRFESTTLGSTWRMAAGTFYGQQDAGR